MDFLNYIYFNDDIGLGGLAVENIPRRYLEASNPFEDLSNLQFKKIYRLSKERVADIINMFRGNEPLMKRRSAIGPPQKVLTALRFFGSGSYQMDIGLSRFSNLSQPSVSNCIHAVIDFFNEPAIFDEYVKFYSNFEELRRARYRFWEKFDFPYGVGCIDCTHVAIVPPPNGHPEYPEHIYVNRKGYHSINVQLICDADFRIMNVNARFPGSSHDSFIWNNSNVQPLVRQIHEDLDGHYVLLGDSGYPLRPWLLTPFINPARESPEERYNTNFCRARSIIERVNGILKMRFRCMLKQRVLHYSPPTAAKIINTCTVLHNMAIIDNRDNLAEVEALWENNDDFGLFDQMPPEDDAQQPLGRVNPELAAGRVLQRQIARHWFP